MRQAFLGLGVAIVIGVVWVLASRAAMVPNYGFSRHVAFSTVLGIGLAAGVLAAILAAWNGSWWGRASLVLVGVFCVWIGLFLASDKAYRVWQSMPNPPDRAFADTAPMGVLLVGWLPGGLVVGAVFGLAMLAFGLARRAGKLPR